jgi:hypothetical protein
MGSKELVIAAYDKPLDWLSTLNSDVKKTVYRKGDALPLNENEILIHPNIGRCVHTFFNHLVIRYDDLSDYTFFVQDYPFDHWENLGEIINGDMSQLNEKATLSIGGYFGFHFNTIKVHSDKGGLMHTMHPSQHHVNGNIIACSSNGHPHDHNPNINVDKYWDLLFDEPKPNFYEFMPGGHFTITKEHVILRSREFYEKIVKLLVDDITAPWMIERLECYIFNPKYKSKM